MKLFKSILYIIFLVPITLSAQETAPPSILDTPANFSGWQEDTTEPSTLDTIRIGFFAPDQADDPVGGPMKNAATLALEQANNAGGFHGVPFGLIQRWSDNPWGAGSKKMIQMVYEDSVWVVIGSIDGEFTHIAEQIVTKAWLPLLSPVSADPTLNYIKIPWMFRLPPGDDQQAQVIVQDGLQKQMLANIGMITSMDHDGRIFQEDMMDQLNAVELSPVFHFEVETANIDYDLLGSRALSFHPDAIILRLPGEKILQLIKSLDKSGSDIPLFLPWIPGLSVQSLSESYSGPIYSVRPFSIQDNQRYQLFAQEYIDKFGIVPTPVAAYTYEAFQLFLNALENSGLNRVAIRQAIVNLQGYDGVSGTIRWDNGWANQGEPMLE